MHTQTSLCVPSGGNVRFRRLLCSEYDRRRGGKGAGPGPEEEHRVGDVSDKPCVLFDPMRQQGQHPMPQERKQNFLQLVNVSNVSRAFLRPVPGFPTPTTSLRTAVIPLPGYARLHSTSYATVTCPSVKLGQGKSVCSVIRQSLVFLRQLNVVLQVHVCPTRICKGRLSSGCNVTRSIF